MSRPGRTLLALAGASIALVIAAWFDTTVMGEPRRQAAATFDPTGAAGISALGSVLVAGAVLLVGALAWNAASLVAGLAYGVVGAVLAALPWLVWNLAAQRNEAPPILPEPLASALNNLYFSTAGSLNAVGTIGAAMLVAGIASIVRSPRRRSVPVRPG